MGANVRHSSDSGQRAGTPYTIKTCCGRAALLPKPVNNVVNGHYKRPAKQPSQQWCRIWRERPGSTEDAPWQRARCWVHHSACSTRSPQVPRRGRRITREPKAALFKRRALPPTPDSAFTKHSRSTSTNSIASPGHTRVAPSSPREPPDAACCSTHSAIPLLNNQTPHQHVAVIEGYS
ncbi:hypothetical protein BDV96DRAFT_291745 [Lophiotrema nucula]|uniref:Uncharacterized protein n=1 Tax=Lophiotrema nucula TaxID=690887 RepID=A0A6A5YLS3_9PLEO|nr:hypothetical protein BDV96DRAFT_291745 [Lophiotrema nucula]